jgi:hypothetical protein
MKAVYKKYAKTIAPMWMGCFILFLFIYMFVISPQRQHKREIYQQVSEKKRTYEMVLKTDQTEAKTELKKQIEQWRDKLKNFVVNPEDMAGLTFDIGQIASEIKLDSFSIKAQDNRRGPDSSPSQYFWENQISVSFRADFNKFAAFLNAMERHRPPVFVGKFRITHSEHENLSQVNMDLSVFVKKPQGG